MVFCEPKTAKIKVKNFSPSSKSFRTGALAMDWH